MIISASRRTDIPAFYSEWMFNRLKEKYVLVRNPMNPHKISRVNLSGDVVDAIVFWTKNPIPMLSKLNKLEGYPYYFQFTLNAYGMDVEKNLPSKEEILIPAFQKLSREIGRERVVWRYDPIFFSERYDMEYHCKSFQEFAAKLGDYTEKCTVSFLDFYKDTEYNMRSLHVIRDTVSMQRELLERFVRIADEYGLYIDTCAEAGDFEDLGVKHASCIDKERIERIGDFKLQVNKDAGQRKECGCVASIDIGAYSTCKNGCLYCYANHGNRQERHYPDSPLLLGEVQETDEIREREMKSFIQNQLSLFDL